MANAATPSTTAPTTPSFRSMSRTKCNHPEPVRICGQAPLTWCPLCSPLDLELRSAQRTGHHTRSAVSPRSIKERGVGIQASRKFVAQPFGARQVEESQRFLDGVDLLLSRLFEKNPVSKVQLGEVSDDQ